ncbi:hypothetical protein MUG84_12640 [Paenibacillus sp. KQZ6P-2]|uniref:Lipoprotein n=1 Tax=Paenibacillus mangrovi TaxID=2931978 RepID=A0A9X1WPB2_9BACL|nr:hypothetical protein [Paenibacillus mangrovi]MCJ8012579.1 hypothetical protein [Paenibacillus mangrovi]
MNKKVVFFMLTAWLLLTAGCSASKDQPSGGGDFSADEAIAKTVKEKNRNDFPSKAGRIEGIIKGGGPSPGIRIPGIFESRAKKEKDSSYLVTLTEYWDAKNFRTQGTSAGDTLSYHWQYRVTPEGIQLLDQGGDFPPDQVE